MDAGFVPGNVQVWYVIRDIWSKKDVLTLSTFLT